MAREVPNDDFCKFMITQTQFKVPVCTHFDTEEDTCDLDECQYSPKWLRWFEYMENID